MNEGHLGKFSFGGERAATDNHPAIIHYLPLSEDVTASLAVGTLLKAVDVYGASVVAGEESSGVTGASVDAATFSAKVGSKVGTYVFSYDSEWKLSGQSATLSEYGVTPEGSPSSGDTLTVTLVLSDVLYTPFKYADTAEPCAVVDLPCDPTGKNGEKSAACVVHGTVKARVLKTGDGQTPTSGQLASLARRGVFAV
ncbi:MAG TPA: hypothetical protein H9768_01715 [Candidatus Mailhella merdavium]|nr:hypothetical protein [Candidatus Mailhella merdavium]